MMKIGIEGQRLFREKKHGMDMVALELVKELQQIDHENEYYIYIKPDVDSDCLKGTDNFHIVELDGGSYPAWEQSALPKAAHSDGCQLLHCTSNTAPLNPKMPLVVTLHDIIYMEKSYLRILTDKGTNYQKFGNVYRRYIVPRIMKRADKIITVSNFERKRIGDFFGLPESDDRLVAIYNGVSRHFVRVTDEGFLNRVKAQYKLPDNYFFFLGNTDPKKNTKGVLKAFSDFRKQNDEDYVLVMLDYDRDELKKLLNEINDPELENHIHLTGYVVNTDLPAIYTLCKIFLYPSLRESFGIPMLEAMKCGVPVITSNTSSMPEVSGGNAYIVDPYDPAQITKGMFELLGDKNLRKDLVKKGYQQAEKFSWRAMAEQVLALYQEIKIN
jgi:glycosyltransferase involved in cell wall biosynthesis